MEIPNHKRTSKEQKKKRKVLLNGGSILDVPKRVYNVIRGKQGGEEAVNRMLNSYGNDNIISIIVCRIPLQQAIIKVGNLLSNGGLDKAKRDLHYDNLFHLYMLINFANKHPIILEKNQSIHYSTSIPNSKILKSNKLI